MIISVFIRIIIIKYIIHFTRNAENWSYQESYDLFYKIIQDGYLESTKTFLSPVEKEYLPYAALLFPYMQAVRFFTDYINGDTYYKIKYPEHNLVRTRAQFKLLQSLEENFDTMQDIVKRAAGK